MTKSRHAVVLALLLSGGVVGCDAPVTPTPKPDPSRTEQICDHVVDVVRKAETGEDEAVLSQIRTDCQTSLTEIEQRHASLTGCFLVAHTPDEIDACEKPAKRYDSVLRSAVPNNAAVCTHVMDVMKREMGDTATQMADSDLEKFTTDCITDLDREREKIGAAMFRKQATCVLASKSMEDMMKCEPKQND